MDISNLITLLGVFAAIITHLMIVSAKISKFVGTTEQYLANLTERIDGMEDNHQHCQVRTRIDKAEQRQEVLRDKFLPDLTQRLARMEQEILDVKVRLDDIKTEMKEFYSRRDRRVTD